MTLCFECIQQPEGQETKIKKGMLISCEKCHTIKKEGKLVYPDRTKEDLRDHKYAIAELIEKNKALSFRIDFLEKKLIEHCARGDVCPHTGRE